MQDKTPSKNGGASFDNTEEGLRLLQTKNERKKLETELEALSNRVNMLETEHMKAEKKLDDTRKKCQEIMDIKKKNEEAARQKEEAII